MYKQDVVEKRRQIWRQIVRLKASRALAGAQSPGRQASRREAQEHDDSFAVLGLLSALRGPNQAEAREPAEVEDAERVRAARGVLFQSKGPEGRGLEGEKART